MEKKEKRERMFVAVIIFVLASSAAFMLSCGKTAGTAPPPNEEVYKFANAWIFLDEDEPGGTNYNSQGSCYQRLISQEVYNAVDILFICFVTTVPTDDGSWYTIKIKDKAHPGGLTNQNYMDYVIADARKVNPDILIAVTLDYGGDGKQIQNIFSNQADPAEAAARFADNLMSYLKQHNLDGFDIDWEAPLSDETSQDQFKQLINAIGNRFSQEYQQTGKKYYLTISPATAENLDAAAINQYVDFLNLQLYSGFTNPSDFTGLGINPKKLAYGAKFEAPYSGAKPDDPGYEDAAHAYSNGTAGGYTIFTNWRLNSENFEFEQDQQKILYNKVHGGNP
jgi:hypothetical protein